MEFFEVVRSRRSVRDYEDKVIPDDLIDQLIDAGRLAATARNEQPWEFIIIKEKPSLASIAELCPNGAFLSKAGALIVIFSKSTKYYIEDCSAATQNILLAAHALGLGGCWIAGDKKEYAEQIKLMLNVPDGYSLVSMISIGYPVSLAGYKEKRELTDLKHMEKWQTE